MNQELLQEVKDRLQQIAELLYQENAQMAYQMIIMIIPKIEIISDNIDNDDVKDALANKLNMMLEAMENEDYVLMADTIQYELLNTISEL